MVCIVITNTRNVKSYLVSLDGTPQTWNNEEEAQKQIDALNMTGQGYGIPRKQTPVNFTYSIEPTT